VVNFGELVIDVIFFLIGVIFFFVVVEGFVSFP